MSSTSPFVGNSLGQDNYKYFILLLFMHVIAGTLWQVTALYMYRRAALSWLMTMFMGYSALWMVLILSLLNYHLYLLTINLTTNEHINSAKYTYLKDQYNDFDNPFRKSTTCANITDGLFPALNPCYSRISAVERRSNCGVIGCGHDHGKGQSSTPGDIEMGETRNLLLSS